MTDLTNTKDMSPQEFKDARHALGLSANGMANLLGVATGRTIRFWEKGDNDIAGPAIVLVRALMASAAVRKHFGLSLKHEREKSVA